MAQQRPTLSLYNSPFYNWTHEQPHLLRDGRVQDIDRVTLIAEIERLGRSQASSLPSGLRLGVLSLLKPIHQPEQAAQRGRNNVHRERLIIRRILDENPGRMPRLSEAFGKAYNRARREVAFNSDLPLQIAPMVPDLTLDRIRDETLLPSPGSTATEPMHDA